MKKATNGKTKDKSKDNMGTAKTSNHHRPRETQDQKSKNKKKKKNKQSIIPNGTVNKPEVLIVPSSSSESHGGGEKPKKSVVSKRQRTSNGNPSSCSKKQRRRKEEEEQEEEVDEEAKLNVIPMNRVQRIVKSGGPDLKINQEAYFLINKATEKFIGQFCEDAFTSAAARDRKRYLKYSHLSSLVAKERRYDFLSDFVPEKMKAEDALKEIEQEET
ncbi:uncharacterized protein LOC116198761 [Punica granatum]|uniref:Uncharacterized protein LOC116198761 n=2 Tax=Punica granatum TaxID=22663 RepID=A0A6P8CKW2_PUNGR|nr:uncharacterized protein LOC116198761 [Punica granatum]PKI62602.1 hypothetical protein CRG98_017024 [Punica granatum]